MNSEGFSFSVSLSYIYTQYIYVYIENRQDEMEAVASLVAQECS